MPHPDASPIGKHILVGLTYLDRTGAIAKQLQLHGRITRLGEHTLVFERADGGGDFSVPNDGALSAADPDAVYTLRSTGEAVANVDIVASWTIHPGPDAA